MKTRPLEVKSPATYSSPLVDVTAGLAPSDVRVTADAFASAKGAALDVPKARNTARYSAPGWSPRRLKDLVWPGSVWERSTRSLASAMLIWNRTMASGSPVSTFQAMVKVVGIMFVVVIPKTTPSCCGLFSSLAPARGKGRCIILCVYVA